MIYSHDWHWITKRLVQKILSVISGVLGFRSNYRACQQHSRDDQTETEIVTTQGKIFQALYVGKNSFPAVWNWCQAILLPFWRTPPTKLPESRRMSEVSETTRAGKNLLLKPLHRKHVLFFFEEISREAVVTSSSSRTPLGFVNIGVPQLRRSWIHKGASEKHEWVRRHVMGDATICSSSMIWQNFVNTMTTKNEK